MQAVFFEGNRTLRVGESVAVEPGAGQVQIRVAYCGICGTDLHLFHGAMAHRLTLPHVMGHEMSGTIAAVGGEVAGWRVGDRVTVRPLDPCGHCPACAAGHSHICHPILPTSIPSKKPGQRSNNTCAQLGPEASRTSTKLSPKPSLSSLPTMLKHGSGSPCQHYRNCEYALAEKRTQLSGGGAQVGKKPALHFVYGHARRASAQVQGGSDPA